MYNPYLLYISMATYERVISYLISALQCSVSAIVCEKCKFQCGHLYDLPIALCHLHRRCRVQADMIFYSSGNQDLQHGCPRAKTLSGSILDTSIISSYGNVYFRCVLDTVVSSGRPNAWCALPVSQRSQLPLANSLTLRVLGGLSSTQNAYALPLHRRLVNAYIKNQKSLIALSQSSRIR